MGKHGTGHIIKACLVCNANFKAYTAHIKRGQPAKFCSRKCQGIYKSLQPSTAKMITNNCLECGGAFSRRQGSGGTMEYCSIGCMAVARGRAMAGENHPKWAGGKEWRSHAERKAIKTALNLTPFCQDCGAIDGLQGHHKNSYSEFPELREAIENIEILCIRCHASRHPEIASFILKDSRHAA